MKVKGLSRIDSKEGRLHGWYARIRRGKTESRKWFSDCANGGKARSRELAILWLRAEADRLGVPWTQEIVVTRSRTGRRVIGVRRIKKKGGFVWEAALQSRGKVRRTAFSVSVHGERNARSMALAMRRRWEEEVYGSTLS